MAGCAKLRGQTAGKRQNIHFTVNLILSSQSVMQIGSNQLVLVVQCPTPTNPVTNSMTC